MIEGLGNPQDALRGIVGSRVSEVTERLVIEAEQAREQAEVEEAAGAFESYFATMLVKELRRALPEGMFQGAGSDVYTAWFDEHVGKSLSDRDALGIGSMIRTAIERRNQVIPAEQLVESSIAPPPSDEASPEEPTR